MKRYGIPLVADNGTESTILLAVRDHSPLSRARLSELSGLPHAAISRSAAKLIDRGLLVEKRNADKSGVRAKRGLCLNPGAGLAIGVEYSSGSLIGVLVDSSYRRRSLEAKKLDLASMDNKERFGAILSFIRKLLASCAMKKERIMGIGLADPGVVEPVNGMAIGSTILPGWNDIPVARKISDALGLPSVLMNTMKASITAVDHLEISGDQGNVIFVEYGEGIACGMKLDGRYYGGSGNRAGEIGHFRISERAVPCRCGSVGCLEAIASMPSLVREAKAALTTDSSSSLSALGDFDGKAVLAAAASGDRLAGRVVDEAFRHLARAVSGMANLLSPEMIILDSSLSLAGERSFKSFEREFELSLLSEGGHAKIFLSKLGNERNALGAAFNVLDIALGENRSHCGSRILKTGR